MPRDSSRSPRNRRRRSRSRSRDRYRDVGHRGRGVEREHADYHKSRRIKDRESRREDDRQRRDHEKDRRKDEPRWKRDISDDSHNKDYPRDTRLSSRSPDITEKPENGEGGIKEDAEPKTEEEKEMLKIMGFCNFDSTKGKHIAGNDVYVASIRKKRRYRQYMNRRGGFNRKLDPVA